MVHSQGPLTPGEVVKHLKNKDYDLNIMEDQVHDLSNAGDLPGHEFHGNQYKGGSGLVAGTQEHQAESFLNERLKHLQSGGTISALDRMDVGQAQKGFPKNESIQKLASDVNEQHGISATRVSKEATDASTKADEYTKSVLAHQTVSGHKEAMQEHEAAAVAHTHARWMYDRGTDERKAHEVAARDHDKMARSHYLASRGAFQFDTEKPLPNSSMKTPSLDSAMLGNTELTDAGAVGSSRLSEAAFTTPVKGEKLTGRAIHLGALAHAQFKKWKNPASWVEDEGMWDKAKEAASKTYSLDDEAYWPVVAHIYEQMGGGVKEPEGKANADLQAALAVANGDTPGHEFHGNQWAPGSGAAFEASTKAHQASAQATKSGSAIDHAAANEAHLHAARMHEAAADSTETNHEPAQVTLRRMHDNMADAHTQMANVHDETAHAIYKPEDELPPGDRAHGGMQEPDKVYAARGRSVAASERAEAYSKKID